MRGEERVRSGLTIGVEIHAAQVRELLEILDLFEAYGRNRTG